MISSLGFRPMACNEITKYPTKYYCWPIDADEKDAGFFFFCVVAYAA